MTDVCCGKNLCQNKIRWSIILRYGLHILFTRRYHLPQANFDQEHFVIWKWFVYHHFCDKCSSWTQNNLLFHSITVKTPSPVNLYYCFYYYKDTVSRLQCISHFYSLNRVARFLGFTPGSLAPSPCFVPEMLLQFWGGTGGTQHPLQHGPLYLFWQTGQGKHKAMQNVFQNDSAQRQGLPQLFMRHVTSKINDSVPLPLF